MVKSEAFVQVAVEKAGPSLAQDDKSISLSRMTSPSVEQRPKGEHLRLQKKQATHGGEWPVLAKSSGEEGKLVYMLGGAVAVGDVCCAGAALSPPVVFVIKRTSTRRFFARPSEVLLESTGLSLPKPIR